MADVEEERRTAPAPSFMNVDALFTLWRVLCCYSREKFKRWSTSLGTYLDVPTLVYPEVVPLTAEEERRMAEEIVIPEL